MRNVNFETALVHVLFFGTASCERLLSLLNRLQKGQGDALDLHPCCPDKASNCYEHPSQQRKYSTLGAQASQKRSMLSPRRPSAMRTPLQHKASGYPRHLRRPSHYLSSCRWAARRITLNSHRAFTKKSVKIIVG